MAPVPLCRQDLAQCLAYGGYSIYGFQMNGAPYAGSLVTVRFPLSLPCPLDLEHLFYLVPSTLPSAVTPGPDFALFCSTFSFYALRLDSDSNSHIGHSCKEIV